MLYNAFGDHSHRVLDLYLPDTWGRLLVIVISIRFDVTQCLQIGYFGWNRVRHKDWTGPGESLNPGPRKIYWIRSYGPVRIDYVLSWRGEGWLLLVLLKMQRDAAWVKVLRGLCSEIKSRPDYFCCMKWKLSARGLKNTDDQFVSMGNPFAAVWQNLQIWFPFL